MIIKAYWKVQLSDIINLLSFLHRLGPYHSGSKMTSNVIFFKMNKTRLMSAGNLFSRLMSADHLFLMAFLLKCRCHFQWPVLVVKKDKKLV